MGSIAFSSEILNVLVYIKQTRPVHMLNLLCRAGYIHILDNFMHLGVTPLDLSQVRKVNTIKLNLGGFLLLICINGILV